MNRLVRISMGLALSLGTQLYFSSSPPSEPLLVGESPVKIKKPSPLVFSENDFPQIDAKEQKRSIEASSTQTFSSASSSGGFGFGGSPDVYGASGGASFPSYFGSGNTPGPGGGDSGSAQYKIHKLKEGDEPLAPETSKASLALGNGPFGGGFGTGFGGRSLSGGSSPQGNGSPGEIAFSKDPSDFLPMGKASEKKETPSKEEKTAEAPKSDILIPPTIASSPTAARESSSSQKDFSSLLGAPAPEKALASSGGVPAQQQAQATAPQESGGNKGGGQQPQIPMMPPPSDKGGGGSPSRKAAAEDAAQQLAKDIERLNKEIEDLEKELEDPFLPTEQRVKKERELAAKSQQRAAHVSALSGNGAAAGAVTTPLPNFGNPKIPNEPLV